MDNTLNIESQAYEPDKSEKMGSVKKGNAFSRFFARKKAKKRQKERKLSNGAIKKQKKAKIKFKDYFLNGSALTKNNISVKYTGYYKKWKEFNTSSEGAKWRYLVNKKIEDKNEEADLINNKNNNGDKNQGQWIGHNWKEGKLRKWKWSIWYSTIIAFFISLFVFGAVELKATGSFSFWLNPWFYGVIFLVYAIFYFAFLIRQQYQFMRYNYATLTQNVVIKRQELKQSIQLAKAQELENDSSIPYYSWNALKNESAKTQVVNEQFANEYDYKSDNEVPTDMTGRVLRDASDSSVLSRFEVFEPKLVKTEKMGWQIDKSSKFHECGYVITCLNLKTQKDINYTKDNGFVPRQVWNDQFNDSDKSTLNQNQSISAPYFQQLKNSPQFEVWRNALLIASRCHSVLTAGTGKGKTGYVMLYTVIALLNSILYPSIFLNSKGDDLDYIYNWAVVSGYTLKNFNLISTETSDKFNPFSPAYKLTYSLYQLQKENIEEINISPNEYQNTWFFTIRKFRFRKLAPDNIDYALYDNAYVRVNRNSKTGSYLYTARDLLDEIVRQTNDKTLYQDLEKIAPIPLDRMDTNSFSKFFLSAYATKRGNKRIDYTIGQINQNTVTMSLENPQEYQKWFGKDKLWWNATKWYLCGFMGFETIQEIYNNATTLEGAWTSAKGTLLTESCEALIFGERTQEQANDYWANSGFNLYKAIANVFLGGLLRDGPEIFAEEYFTPNNISNNCVVLEMTQYTKLEQYKLVNEKLKKSQQEGTDPYSLLALILAPYDATAFDGVNTSTSQTPDTWNGITSSRSNLTAKFMDAEFIKATCFSNFEPETFFTKPTIVITVGVDGTDNSALARKQLILSIFGAVFKAYERLHKHNKGVSMRPWFAILDEFSMVQWQDYILSSFILQGRARGYYLMAITQTKFELQNRPNGEKFLNNLEINAGLVYSLGDDEPKARQETADTIGKYIGTDFNGVTSKEQLEKGDLPFNEQYFISPVEVSEADLGVIFGRIQTKQGKMFFKCRSNLFYTSKIFSQLSDDERITPNKEVKSPLYDFSKDVIQNRFDYAIYLLWYSDVNSISHSNKNVFETEWNHTFKPEFSQRTDNLEQRIKKQSAIVTSRSKLILSKQRANANLSLKAKNKQATKNQTLELVVKDINDNFSDLAQVIQNSSILQIS